MRNPLITLLGSLCLVLSVLGDLQGAIPVAVMVSSAVTLLAWQHGRAARALVALCVTEPSTVTVRRRSGDAAAPKSREVPVTEIVVGDVVLLQARRRRTGRRSHPVLALLEDRPVGADRGDPARRHDRRWPTVRLGPFGSRA